MAEGTRFRGLDEKLGVHDTKISEMREELVSVKDGLTTQITSVDGKVGDLTLRIDKLDAHFEELKLLIRGMKPTNNQSTMTQLEEASSSITNNQFRFTTSEEVNPPFPTTFNSVPLSVPCSTAVPSTAPMPHVIAHHTPPVYMSAPSQIYVSPSLNTPLTTPYLYTNSTATTPVPQHNFTNGLTVYPNQFQPPPHPTPIHNYIHPNHIPPNSPTYQFPTPHPHFNPSPKIEFPKFDGTDPKGWAVKVEQYFDFINMDDHRKIKLAAIHLEGKASVWYRSYQNTKPVVNWKCFLQDVLNRFENPDQRDIQDLFNKLKQFSSVSEYEDQFEELRALLVAKNKSFPEDYYISSFFSGLKDNIKATVRMFRPQTLADAIFLAKQEESKGAKSTHLFPKMPPGRMPAQFSPNIQNSILEDKDCLRRSYCNQVRLFDFDISVF